MCRAIIESNSSVDYIVCGCGEIGIGGGSDKLQCYANDFSNFLRVDDEGNDIVVSVKDPSKPTRKELLKMLKEMIENTDKLPSQALFSPVMYSDFVSLMLLLSAILESGVD